MSYTLSVPGDDSHLYELVHGILPSIVNDGLIDNPVDLLMHWRKLPPTCLPS